MLWVVPSAYGAPYGSWPARNLGDDALNLPDQRLVEQVQRHEGLRLEAYLCPAGKITIGYGHNLQANPVTGIPAVVGTRITQDQAQRLLVADLMETRRKVLERFPVLVWAGAISGSPAASVSTVIKVS